MLNVFRSRHLPAVLSVCLIAAVMVLVGGCDQDTEQLLYEVNGPITVSYISVTPSGGTQRSSGIKASKLFMFEDYVVIKHKSRGGTLVPLANIINLNWQ